MTQVSSKNIHTFKELHSEASNYRETYVSGRRYIILSRYGDTIPSIQSYLRKKIEISTSVTHVLITSRFSAVHPAIQSRAISLRMDPILSLHLTGYKSPEKLLSDELIDIYSQDMEPANKQMYQKIKSLAKDIIKYNISCPELFRNIIEKVHRDVTWTHHQKYEIISYLACQEPLYRSSYRKLLYLEGILLHIYQIRNTFISD